MTELSKQQIKECIQRTAENYREKYNTLGCADITETIAGKLDGKLPDGFIFHGAFAGLNRNVPLSGIADTILSCPPGSGANDLIEVSVIFRTPEGGALEEGPILATPVGIKILPHSGMEMMRALPMPDEGSPIYEALTAIKDAVTAWDKESNQNRN